MAKYRKKPVVVEANQWFPNREVAGVEWEPVEIPAIDIDGRPRGTVTDNTVRPYVVTIHGQRAYLEPGDWVIAERDGLHHYPCKPADFAAIYEPADPTHPCSPQQATAGIAEVGEPRRKSRDFPSRLIYTSASPR